LMTTFLFLIGTFFLTINLANSSSSESPPSFRDVPKTLRSFSFVSSS